MCAYHLPALCNPLLNVLFNNPSLASMASLVQELQPHSEITVLVPPPERFSEEGLTEDFIRSHIVRNSSGVSSASAARKANPYIYTTLSGKQVLVKNGHVFSGKGFRESRKVSIVGFDGVAAWADYLPRGSVYGCIYISAPLCGNVTEVFEAPLFPPLESASKCGLDWSHCGSPELPALPPASRPSSALPAPPASPVPSDSPVPSHPTFSDLLQNFPALSRTMASAFYTLFHHNNRNYQDLRSRKSLPLSQIKKLFAAMVAEAFRIVQDTVNSDSIDGDRVHNLLTSVSMKNPTLDMNRLVHEFVEFNIYDRLWSSLVFQFTNPYTTDPNSGNIISQDTVNGRADKENCHRVTLTPQLYRDLSCLSLNQLDIPVEEPWNLNILYRRVEDAIKVFSELSGSRITNQREKVAILTRTVQVLTESGPSGGSPLLVDADTLIGLLIMVIVHSKVPNLECHLYYIQNFGLGSAPELQHKAEPGYLNYILSNFNAVVFHLQGSNSKEIRASSENYAFWAAIQKMDYVQVESLLSHIDSLHSLPRSHFLHSKNIHGESFWFIAIRANDSALFKLLLDKTQHVSCIDDLVFDTNTSTSQNLLMVALQHENPDIIHSLIDVLVFNLSDAEITAYVNFPDHRGRTVGHYLSHDLAALQRLGRFVNWGQKDHSSQTPLFGFCRAYDHPAYKRLIAAGFRFSNVSYNVHTDRSGNTLLHALSRGITETGLITGEVYAGASTRAGKQSYNCSGAVDVNELNARGLSPASLSMRYNRLENLQVLLLEKSFIFALEDPKSFHNLSDSYSFSAAKKNHSGVCEPEFRHIENLVVSSFFEQFFPKKCDFQYGIISGKYDGAKRDWQLHGVCRTRVSSPQFLSLNTLKKIIKVFWMSNTMSFMPMDKFWVNFPETKPNDPINAKFRLNRLLDHVNLFLSSLAFTEEKSQVLFRDLVERSSEESVFDMAKALGREKTPQARLDSQKLQEMYYFVDFSKNNLVKYRHVMRKLSNLTSCGKIKYDDMWSAYDDILRALPVGPKRDYHLHPMGTFHRFVAWLEACTEQLISQYDILFGKIHLWETLYKQIKGLNKEISELEETILKRSPGQETPLQNRNAFSIESVPADEHFKDDSDFTSIFGLGASKKVKYKRLVTLKAEHVTKISDLNVNLRMSHEAVAAETSQFLSYRSNMLALGLKRLAKDSVLSLRHRNVQLEKCLESVRMTRPQLGKGDGTHEVLGRG